MISLRTLLTTSFLLAASFSIGAAEKADLVLLGGRIITVDDSCPTAEALACRDGRLLTVGSRQGVSQRIGPNTKTIVNGTDAPVEDVDPLGIFYASVTRRLADGTLFFPEQCMTREEALRSYTVTIAKPV